MPSSRAETQDGVAKGPLFSASVVQYINDISGTLNRTVVDREQHVTLLQTDVFRSAALGYFMSNRAVRPGGPQDTVFDFLPCRARSDIRDPQTQQCRHDNDGQGGS